MLIPTQTFVNCHFYSPPGKIGLLYGDSSIYSVSTIIMSEIIRRNGRVVVVDGANRTDPFFLAKLARYRGVDPCFVLDNAYVSRANTFYQLDVTITDGLLEFMQSVCALSLIVLGPLDLADDEQIPMHDVQDVLSRVKTYLNELRIHHISTLLVSKIPRFQLQDRTNLFLSLREMSDAIYRTELSETEHHIILEQGEYHGKNNTNGNDASPARRSKLVKIPPGAQKRGSRYSR